MAPKTKITLLMVIIAFAAIIFLWCGVRPSWIRSRCQGLADGKIQELIEINRKFELRDLGNKNIKSKFADYHVRISDIMGPMAMFNSMHLYNFPPDVWDHMSEEDKTYFILQSPTIQETEIYRTISEKEYISCLRRSGFKR